MEVILGRDMKNMKKKKKLKLCVILERDIKKSRRKVQSIIQKRGTRNRTQEREKQRE